MRLQKLAKTESSELYHSTQARLLSYLAAQSIFLSKNTLSPGGYLSPHLIEVQYIWLPCSIIKKVYQPTRIKYIRSPYSTIGTNLKKLLVEFRTKYQKLKIKLACSTMRVVYLEGCTSTSLSRMLQINLLYQKYFIIGLYTGCPALLLRVNLEDCSWYAKLRCPELISAPPIQNRLLTFTSPIYVNARKRKSHFTIPMPSQCLFDQVRHSRLCQ